MDRLTVNSLTSNESALVVRSGNKTHVSFRGRTYLVEKPSRRRVAESSNGEIRAPMPGQIVDVLRKSGDLVVKGDRLIVLEAMKMQQPILAISEGKILEILVKLGDQVEDGQILVKMVDSR